MNDDLPPLPLAVDAAPFNYFRVYAYTADQMREYAHAAIAKVSAERDALRADAERLAWADQHALCIDQVADPDNLVRVWWGTDPAKTAHGFTLRAAIDAARAAREKT